MTPREFALIVRAKTPPEDRRYGSLNEREVEDLYDLLHRKKAENGRSIRR